MIPDLEREQHARRIVWRRLVEARDIKNRLVGGEARPWEAVRLASVVREARAYARVARALTTRTALPEPGVGLSYRCIQPTRSNHP